MSTIDKKMSDNIDFFRTNATIKGEFWHDKMWKNAKVNQQKGETE